MAVLTREHVKLLYNRFVALYGERFAKVHNPTIIEIWYEEWFSSLRDISTDHVRIALEKCKLTLEWPPSIAEFRGYCEEASGLPSPGKGLTLAVRREFTHPVIRIAFDLVGEWSLKNDKEEILRKKWNDAYKMAISQYRADPQGSQERLKKALERHEEVKLLPKIPSKAEILGFKQRLADWTTKVAGKKENASESNQLGLNDHPVFDTKKTTMNSYEFDQKEYNYRRDYLIGLSEYEAESLSRVDMYDRIRFKREKLAQDQLSQDRSHVR